MKPTEPPLAAASSSRLVTARTDRAVREPSHAPLRPRYDCARCGEPWPCAPAKVELAEQYQRDLLSLGQYPGAQMADAMDRAVVDPGWGKVDNLYDRFLGWLPRGRGDRHAA